MPRNEPQATTRCWGPADLPGQTGEGICGRLAVGRGLCGSHNRRWLRNGGKTLRRRRAPIGSPKQQRPPNNPERGCKHEDGCPNDHWSDGWCSMHYTRVYKTGDPGPVGPLRPRVKRGECRHPDGCPLPGNYGDGWCTRHGERVKKYGDPGPLGRVYAWPSKFREQHVREAAGQVFIDGDTEPALHPALAKSLEHEATR